MRRPVPVCPPLVGRRGVGGRGARRLRLVNPRRVSGTRWPRSVALSLQKTQFDDRSPRTRNARPVRPGRRAWHGSRFAIDCESANATWSAPAHHAIATSRGHVGTVAAPPRTRARSSRRPGASHPSYRLCTLAWCRAGRGRRAAARPGATRRPRRSCGRPG